MADLPADESIEVVIRDSADQTREMMVNADGSLTAKTMNELWAFQGKVYSLSGEFNAASGGNDNPILLIKNPSGSGKTLYLLRLYVGCVVTNVPVEWKIAHTPTITLNGTSQTPQNFTIGGAASAMTVFSLPTLVSIGTVMGDFGNGQNAQGMELLTGIPILLSANQNLVISAAPASNNRVVEITAVWAEI